MKENRKASLGSPRLGLLHRFTSRLTAFEHTPKSAETSPQNVLIFVGGLFDGFLTVPYTTSLADSLPKDWCFAQPLLSSSYNGFGTSSLAKDVTELSKCVAYFRGIKAGKIVLMGHSTGCQDVMEYLTGPNHEIREPIDGGILQAPVSDRESFALGMEPGVYQASCELASNMIMNGQGDEIIPSKATGNFFPAAISASRWYSLASPNHDGSDDYFSSDLPDSKLLKSFGALPEMSPLCILFSGADEYMPPTIDKLALLAKWTAIVKRGRGKLDEEHSGILERASHNLGDKYPEIVDELTRRVVGFLRCLSTQSNL